MIKFKYYKTDEKFQSDVLNSKINTDDIVFVEDLHTITTHGEEFGGTQVQSNWAQSNSEAADYIKNKPSLHTVATSGSYNDLSNKPTLFSGNYNDLSNKPSIPDALIQSDWNQTNTSAKDYIKNKPTIPSLTGYATESWVNTKFDDAFGINADGVSTLAAVLSDNDYTTGILTQIANKVDKETGKGLSSNDYTTTEKNKLAGIATGATAVTESTVSGWGFTKNTGTLTSETDPVFTASAAYGITSTDISNWNAKQNALTFNTDPSSSNKVATMADLTKSNVGLDNVENKSSATIRGELTKSDVANALGYTPPKSGTVSVSLGKVLTGFTINDGVWAVDAITLNKGAVGLGNVDNTADANKSVAYAANAKHIEPLATLDNLGAGMTVGEVKAWIANQFSNGSASIGDYVCVYASVVSNWEYESEIVDEDIQYAFIKIGGSYDGYGYGQYLISSYNLEPVGIVGRNNNQWSSIKWIATTDQIPSVPSWALQSSKPSYTLDEVSDGSTRKLPTTMVASGSNHAGGLVPDTPSTAGTTKFLREDGSWQVPAYPAAQVQSDWNASSGMGEILNKPTILPTPVSEVSGSSVTQALTTNTHYVFGTVTSLTITLGAATSGVVNEYSFEFDSGSTATQLQIPSTVLGIDTTSVKASTHYEVNIKYNATTDKYYGLMYGWEA